MGVNPFDKLCFDVFQSILSFLPPIPYLFQLQRVSKSWLELCRECMQEECSELHWDDTFVYSYNNNNIRDDAKNENGNSASVALFMLIEKTFKNEKQANWFLFFRKVLKNFRKLNHLILKNMDFNDPLFFLLISEWGGSIRNLSLVNCTFKLSGEMFPRGRSEIIVGDTFYGYEFMFESCLMKDTDYIEYFKRGIEKCGIEQVSLARLDNHSVLDYDKETTVSSLCVLKCFPKLKKVISFVITDMFNKLEKHMNKQKKMYSEALPHVELEFDSYTRSCMLLDETKDLELVLKFHFQELISKYHLRRNRLELYKIKFLTDEEKIRKFHADLNGIYTFLHHYSYLSLDTKTLDMRGRNILNYAIVHSDSPTIEFIIHYLAIANNQTSIAEMNELFSSVNKVDGLNTLVAFIKYYPENVNLLVKYKISLNHKMKDGSTIAHYLCNYGKGSTLIAIENSLKDLTPKERIYFFDISIKNDKKETPLDVCLREGNEKIYQHLKNSTIFKPPPSSSCILL